MHPLHVDAEDLRRGRVGGDDVAFRVVVDDALGHGLEEGAMPLLALSERLLGLLARGDVAGYALDGHQPAPFVPGQGDPLLDPHDLAGLADPAQLEARGRTLGARGFHQDVPVVRVDQAPDQARVRVMLLDGVPGHVLYRRADVIEPVVRSGEVTEDDVGGGREQPQVLPFAAIPGPEPTPGVDDPGGYPPDQTAHEPPGRRDLRAPRHPTEHFRKPHEVLRKAYLFGDSTGALYLWVGVV